MGFLNTIAVGLKEIWTHKFRSLLTMFGIVLGVASLVAMSAIIKGMENGMKEAMVAMGGADKVLLRPQMVPPAQEHLADQAPGRTIHDVYALKSSAPLIKCVSPEMALDEVTLTRGGKSMEPSECVGAWPAVLEMNLHTLAHGRFFNEIDEENAHAVCVIGTGIRDELFGSPEKLGREIIPLGEKILIDQQPFTIVGMFAHYESETEAKQKEIKARGEGTPEKDGPKRQKGWGRRGGYAFYRKNHTLYMPLNTAWIRFRAAGGRTGAPPDPRLTDIDIKVADMEKLETSLQQARNVLSMTHKGIEDFNFETQENQVESIAKQIKNARLSGGIIAAISLLVGGIGIMNIMLASINERVREIGTCKAIGATGTDIFVQIVVESVVLSILGSVAGIGASYLLVDFLSFISPTANTPVITPVAMMVGVIFSAAVGIVAGILPALKAARLNPIEALRYE